MHHPRMRGLCAIGVAFAALAFASFLGGANHVRAVDYTWGSTTTGGSWSETTNWNPTGAPTSGDTALLGDATANRTVFYNSAASGTLTGLTFTQTSDFLNELWAQRSIRITNALTLGASSGTARLLIAGTAANVTGTFSGGVTVNSGGVLSLGLYNPSSSATTFVPSLNGNVTVNGGLFELAAATLLGTGTAAGTHTLTGTLTMTSGTFFIDNSASRDRRLSLTGNLTVTGGSVLSNSGNLANNLLISGTVNTFAPQAFDAAKTQISLQATVDQTFSASIPLGTLTARGTGIKTVSNSGAIATLQFIDGSTALNSRTTLKLASDIVSTSAPLGASFSQNADSAGNVEFGIDADAYTLDFSPANAMWAPTKFSGAGGAVLNGTATNTIWALTGTGGVIKARGFNFATSGSTTLTTTIGPGLVLVATGATDTNVLSGSGTIDLTSTFRFSGTSTVAGTPATLSSDRALGDLEVTSGALRLGNTFTSMQNVRVSGGSLDLLSKSLTVPSVQLTGGTITTGTLTSSGTFDMQAGTLAASLLGSGTLTKSGPGLVVLSGSNGYTGGTMIDSGTLQIGGGSAAGSIEGDVAVDGGVLAFGRSDAVTFGGAITGAGAIAMVGSGTTTLTGANGYSGGTTLASGVLALGGADAIGSSGTIDFAGGTLQASAANTADYSARFSTAAGQQYRIDTNGQSIQWNTALTSDGGSLTKNGLGTLALTQDATFSGTTTVNNGTVALGDGGTTGSVAGPIALSNTAALVVNRLNDLALGGVISGTGSLTKQGAGTLSLTAANTFVGATTISAGTLALTGGDNRLATTGTVTFAGNGGLSVGGSQSLARLALADNVSAALTGSGTVTVTGGAFLVGGSGSNTTQTLDASGLSSFNYTNAGSTFKVGGNTTLFGTATGRLILPAASVITAASVGVGSDANNAGTSSGTLTLGSTTAISANTITLGNGQAQGTINYVGATNPTLTIRAANGTSPMANMTIGTTGGFGQTLTSRIDLTGGVTGTSTLDALVTNIVIGVNGRNTGSNTSAILTGGLAMGGGTLTSGTIVLGRATSVGGTAPPGGTPVTTGSLSVAGGTVNVDALFLGDQNWNLGEVRGIFRLDGGGTLNAGTIASGTGTGSGTVVRTFTWNDGTIGNRDASTDLTIGSGVSFVLANAGTHRFSIGPGRSGSVASVLAGVGGTLEKVGGGTLILSANNTYTGVTAVSAGTLLVNGDQSAAVGAVTVDLGATLGGSGSIGGVTTVNGTLSPGNSPGVLTLAELTLGSTSTTLMEITGAARGTDYDGLTLTGSNGLAYGGALSLSFTSTFGDNTTFNLFDFSGLATGSFSSITATGSYGSLTFTNDGLGVWTSGPTSVAGQTMTFTQSTGDLVIVPEPAGVLLVGLGAGIVAWSRRRRT